MILKRIKDLFLSSEPCGIADLDSAETSRLHAAIIQKKPFLKKVYSDFYQQLLDHCPQGPDKILVEIGSGGGFFKEALPHVITSDVVPLPGVDRCFSAEAMPFQDHSVDGLFLLNTFHHIKDIRAFLSEVGRCLKPGGCLVMIEPANTLWSRFIYRHFHHEAFDPEGGWKMSGAGRLSSANGALPWIVFERDRKKFERLFPGLTIREMKPHTPLRYLLSGGFTCRQLVPSCAYFLVKALERLLSPFNKVAGMFVLIKIVRGGTC